MHSIISLLLPAILTSQSIPATDPGVILTTDILARMTSVWTAVRRDAPAAVDTSTMDDSDDTTAEAVRLTLQPGPGWMNTVAEVGPNMVVLAAKFPSVAADLRQAGFTPPQWEEDRRALWTAVLSAQVARLNHTTPSPTSEVGQNIAFLAAHAPAMVALQATGMPVPTVREGMGADTVVVLTEALMKKLGNFWILLNAEDPVIVDTMVPHYRSEINSYDAQMLAICGTAGQGIWRGLDIAKLVRRSPDVAKDLERAGLTVQEYQNLRKSFYLAWLFWQYPFMGKTAPLGSKYARNMEFINSHDYYDLVLNLSMGRKFW